jgi:hypothetical protein
MMKKYFIITAGPTGSGKTDLIKKTLDVLGLPENIEYEKFLIDDLVENDEEYKKEILKIINEIDDKCNNDCETNNNNNNEDCKINCKKETFENPDDDLFEKFNKAYFDVRNDIGCKTINNKGYNCDELLDSLIQNSKSNVIIFETTGINIPKWLLNKTYIQDDYQLVLSYSLVESKKLVVRNKSRAYNSIIHFIEDTKKPAPRLPDVSEKSFREKINTIKDILIDIHKSCILKYDNTKCGDVKINRLIVSDNNGESHKIIYDSFETPNISSENFKKIINSALSEQGGKKIKSIKTKQNKRKNKSKKIIKKQRKTY